MKRVALALAAFGAALALAAPPPLPGAVAREVPGLRVLADTRFEFLLWHVYDVTLWIAGERYSPHGPFALDIRYAMDVRGRDLAARSVEEMRKQGHDDEARLARWQARMDRVFPDIRAGDRLVGAHLPGRGAWFYDARGLLGAIEDAEFARAFFAIWLGERTSEPALRRRLLGTGASDPAPQRQPPAAP